MEQEKIKVLLIEDSRIDVVFIGEMLKRSDSRIDLVCFQDLFEGVNYLKDQPVDLILLDLEFPQVHGLDSFHAVQAQAPQIPTIILTATNNADLAVQAVREGAQDYLVKGEIPGDLLRRAVRFSLERKRLRTKIQEQEILFRSIFENAYHGIMVVDREGAIELFNHRMTEISGYTEDELKSRDVFVLTYDKDIEESRRRFRDLLDGRVDHYRLIKRYRRKDDRLFWAEISVKPLHAIDGHIKGAVAIVVDIDEYKKTEARLLEMQGQQKALLDNIPDMVWLKDSENRYIAVNKAFAKVSGFDPDQVVGKEDRDIWPKELAEKYRIDDREIMASKNQKTIREPLVDKDGRKEWIETIKTPIFNDKGDVSGTTGIARDITERRKYEMELHATLEDLKRFKQVTIDRELKMIELKKKINELSAELGRPEPYNFSIFEKQPEA